MPSDTISISRKQPSVQKIEGKTEVKNVAVETIIGDLVIGTKNSGK